MPALASIRTETVTRIKALAPPPDHPLRATPRFTEATRGPLEELAGQSRVFEVILELDGHDDTLTAGPTRWRAEGAVRVRYDAPGPAVRAMVSEAASRDAQRITAALRNPAGWPEAYCTRVRPTGTRFEDVHVAFVLVVEFAASFIEEVA